ncbi:hypothetical protein IP510_03140 [Psychrobacter sp. NG254]|uniref:hypothetical protein n=1 Tax=Psychrobacter sp. NG254 TaxID=2782003 RepID=UPI001887194F|nr:hypothetical protein [Psychrobacter sp. NG254]MBF2718881.1 hypothetical protein [Psychrobacter sp. NG254]
MDTFRQSLVKALSRAITAGKDIGYAGHTVLAISLVALPVVVQAVTYDTYVIHTYGGDTLLPAVRQQLNSSADGGTVTTYQDKLVLNTTAANYQAVQPLLTQIDGQPQALTVAVRVGNDSSTQSNIRQSQVIISNRGIQGAAIINQSNSQQQGSNLYQVQTLSGSAASISTGTLYSLTQTYGSNRYATNYNLKPQIIIQQQVLLPTTQGIAVTPRLLAKGQVEVQLSQVEETLARSNAPYNRSSSVNHAIQGQRLNSTIIVSRGQWVTIGQISQNSQNQSTNDRSNQSVNSHNSVPISLLVQ